MSATIGILIDVSGSMKQSINIHDKSNHTSTESWARSTFKVVDNLIKHDIGSKADVFAICYGAESKPVTFDLLNTLKSIRPTGSHWNSWNKKQILGRVLDILKTNGAPSICEWAKMDVLTEEVSYDEAKIILKMLENSPRFRSKVVYECLPAACRSPATSFALRYARKLFAGKNAFEGATRQEMRSCIQMALSWNQVAVLVGPSAIVNVSEAHGILHDCVDEKSLTDAQISELMNAIEPYIYGGTPMIEALQAAESLFKRSTSNKKVLFVLSDGMPADKGEIPNFADIGVKVVCCYITENPDTEPKHLYCTENDKWRPDTKFMFRLSSSVPTQSLPRTIFVKHDWIIDIANNETKLFSQVNHPDLIYEVCNFAKDVVSSQDALSDVLSSVSLDLYINKANEGFGAKRQEGGTCYANATATVIHLAMMRIVGRDGGYPDFFELRKKIIAKYGEHGANTLAVLKDICPQYRLQCKLTDIKGALIAVAEKRPVVARFHITDPEWDAFSKFYRNNPKDILTESDLGHPGRNPAGHAVVLVSYNSECLRFMNSWGTEWADNGFFRVSDHKVLGVEFIDVYWTLNDLKQCEITAYEREGPRIAKQLLSALTGLRLSTYKCPLCQRESRVTEFEGKLVQATCPKCGKVFDVNEHKAYDLVLNMYLTSLCH